MKKIIGIFVVIVIIAVIAILWTRRTKTPEEPAMEGEGAAISEEGTSENTTPEVLNEDLEGVDLGDLESELKGIDSELKGLE